MNARQMWGGRVGPTRGLLKDVPIVKREKNKTTEERKERGCTERPGAALLGGKAVWSSHDPIGHLGKKEYCDERTED